MGVLASAVRRAVGWLCQPGIDRATSVAWDSASVNRAPAALVLGLALSTRGTVSAGPCAPRAELAGDPAAVAQVTGELARLGVAIGAAAAGCRAVRAQVQLDDAGIAVAIVDDTRRSEGRLVSDPALAAAWIDSWLRDQLDDAWAQPEVRTGRSDVTARPVTAGRPGTSERPEDATPAVSRSVFDRGTLGLGYERTFPLGGTAWSGIGGHACLRFGRFCLGARAHYAQGSGLTNVLLASTRSDLAVFAAASAAFDLGRMSIAPELGAGVGRITTGRNTTCSKMEKPVTTCDPATDLTCPDTPLCTDANGTLSLVDDHPQHTTTPRLMAALRIAVPLFEHVWLDGIATFAWAPLGHVEPFGVAAQGGTPGIDAKLALPGEPQAMIQLGVGLRIGAP